MGQARSNRLSLKEWGQEAFLLGLLLGVAAFLLLFRLEGVPPGLQHDQGFNGHDAMRVLEGHRPLYFEANFGREPLFIYLTAFFIALLGPSVAAIRWPGVACGLASLAIGYGLFRMLWKRRVALLAMAAMVVSFWFVFVSRVGLRAISQLPLELACFALLWHGLRSGRRWAFALAGVCLGGTLYTYLAARVLPLVLLAFLAYLALWHRSSLFRPHLSSFLWLLLMASVVAAPLGAYAFGHPETVNRRVGELSGALRSLSRGDPGPLLRNAWGFLLTLFVRGEQDLPYHYGLPQRSVLNPAWAILLLVGLALALRRWRKAEYGFLLIWCGATSLPAILAGGSPFFLRAIGAMPSFFLLPALAVEELWAVVDRGEGRSGRLWAKGLIGVGLALLLGFSLWATFLDYFVTWPAHPQTRWIYNADLADLARYLREVKPGPLVYVSTDFDLDLDRYVFAFYGPTPHALRWFDARHTFVVPRVREGEEVLYAFTASAPPPSWLLSRLNRCARSIEDIMAPDGSASVTIYRLGVGDVKRLKALVSPSHRLYADFDHKLALLGYDVEVEVDRGQPVPLFLHLQPLQDGSGSWPQVPGFFVHLVDSRGYLWGQADRLGFAPWDWRKGDLVVEWFEPVLPPDAPPQEYAFVVGMSLGGSRLPILDEDGRPLGNHLRLGSTRARRAVRAEGPSSFPNPVYRVFGGCLALRGYAFPQEVKPGQRWRLVLLWEATAPPPKRGTVVVQGVDAEGDALWEQGQVIWEGIYPTGEWEPGEWVRSYHDFQMPLLSPAGEQRLRLSLRSDLDGQTLPLEDGQKWITLGTLRVVKSPCLLSRAPAIGHPQRARLGENILFLGDLETEALKPGGEVRLTLYWQGLSPLKEDYTVFTHLLDSQGRLWGQKDNKPCGGEAPTITWVPGEVVVDQYIIAVDPSAPPGEYVLEVGMYDQESGERVPVFVNGRAVPEKRILLGTILRCE